MENNAKNIITNKSLLINYLISFLLVGAGIVLKNSYVGVASFFIFLFLPGLITGLLIGIKELHTKSFLLSVGLSVAELMIVGFATNSVFFATSSPLSPYHIFSVLLVVGIVKSIFLMRNKNNLTLVVPTFLRFDILPLLSSFVSLLLVIGGAIRLNNGASNELTLFSLGMTVLTIFLLLLFSKRFSNVSLMVSLFLSGLAILFMVSLRSWGISGHDIRSEYNVYLKTLDGLRWSMSNLHDAYNACMSITVLPTVATEAFGLSGFIFFKVIAQILFALVPLVIYCFARAHLNRPLSIVSSLIFITFPTFLIDSPMIIRQEIGFLFFSLLILVWFGNLIDVTLKTKKILFLLLSVALILSHYSSAYIFVALITLVMGIRILFKLVKRNVHFNEELLTPTIYSIVTVFAILWYSQITAVSTGITGTLINSIKDIPNIYSQDNRDGSVNYIFLKPAVNQGKQIINYEQSTAVRSDAVPNLLFLSETSDSKIASIFSEIYYSVGPKIYELLVAAGLLLLLFFRQVRAKHDISIEFVIFAFLGMFLIFVQVALPNLTLSYGLMRAFQQMLIFLIVPIAIVLSVCLRRLATFGSSLLIVSLLLVYSGFINQFVNGVPAEFSLHNYGPYYTSYYYHASDVSSLSWIMHRGVYQYKNIHSNAFGVLLTVDPQRYNFSKNMLPFQIPITDEVVIGSNAIINKMVYISVSGKLLPVSLKVSDYGKRNIVYSNGKSDILGKERINE